MACCRNYRAVTPTFYPGQECHHRFPSVRDKVLAAEQVLGPLPSNLPVLSTIRALPKCLAYGGMQCGYSTSCLTPFEVFWNLFAFPLIPGAPCTHTILVCVLAGVPNNKKLLLLYTLHRSDHHCRPTD